MLIEKAEASIEDHFNVSNRFALDEDRNNTQFMQSIALFF